MIRAWHFSLYTAVISCPYPEARQTISVDEKTTLEVNQVSGVQVHFPHHSSKEEFEARVKVYYADDPTLPELQPDSTDRKALATPIVQLGPDGAVFCKDVLVQLPLPDCDEIMRRFGVDPHTNLTIYQSSASEGEAVTWEPCSADYSVSQRPSDGLYMVSFGVRHFSWYKAVWDILASTVNGAKVGVSYFYPYIRFSMMCLAMMDETADTKSFGLEVRE